MDSKFNKLLARQIKKHFGETKTIPEELKVFIEDVNSTYCNFEDDLYLLQNSIEISSQELRAAYKQQKENAINQKETIDKIQEVIDTITPEPIKAKTQVEKQENESKVLLDSLIKLVEEQKQFEAEKTKFTLLVEQNPASIIFTDANGNIEYVNSKFCETTGYSPDEVIGNNPKLLKSGNTSSDTYKNLWKTILKGEIWKGEFVNRKKNGDLLLEKATISAVKNKDGEIQNFLAIQEDITEQKQIEQERVRQSSLINSLFNSIPDIIFFKNTDGIYMECNPQFAEFVGKPRKEIIGRSDYDLFNIETADTFRQYDLDMLSSKTPRQNEEWVTYPNGSKVLLDTLKTPYWEGENNLLGILGISRNITARKTAENALKDSELRFEMLSNHSRVYSWQIDKNGLFTYLSKSVSVVLGFESEELIGKKHFYDLIPDFAREKFMKEAFKIFKQKESFINIETPLISKDKKNIWVSSSGIPNFGKAGELIGYNGTDSDITDRKRAEEILLHQSKMQKVLMNMASDFINIPLHSIDNAIEKSLAEMGEFIDADRSYIFSYDFIKRTTTNEFEWCNKDIEPVINDLKDIPLSLFPDWVNTHIKGDLMYVEDVFALPENSLRSILEPQGIKSLLTVPMMNGAECMGFVGFDSVKNHRRYEDKEITLLKLFSHMLVNITNRVESERKLIQTNSDLESATIKANEMAQNAEMANKAKSIFLANMSHEIRTPLNAIIGFSQLLNRDEKLSPSQKEYTLSIIQAGEHLLALINDILELSKMEAGRLELNPVNVNLHSVFSDIQLFFREQIHAKHLQFVFEFAHDVPDFVEVDDNKLRRIFVNLIGNAIKFTDEGSIAVRIKVRDIDEQNKILITEIEDTGHGIDRSEMDKLFQHFVQTKSGISKSSGTGLGLALSRELAIMMGGDITVKSELGKGSVFSFSVKIKPSKNDNQITPIRKKITGIKNGNKKYRILVVDDKKENLLVVVKLLNVIGFETMEAINGKEAIKKFRSWKPDLILMDIRMPLMDGYEATKKIRSLPEGKNTPIVALTASTLKDEQNKAVELGMQGHIGKPFRENELFGTIGNILDIEYLSSDEEFNPVSDNSQKQEENIFSEISLLPQNCIDQMKRAVEVADFELLLELVNNCATEHSALACELKSLVDNYDYEYLEQILNIRTLSNE